MARQGKQRQQELFLGALLTSPTIAVAAKQAGVSEATGSRWLKDAAFQQRYAAAKQQAFGEALAFLQQTMVAAIAVLRATMLDKGTKPATKVSAAGKLLELALRAHELYTIEERLVALEQAQKGRDL